MSLQRDFTDCRLAKARTIFSKTSYEEYFRFPETTQLTEYHWKKMLKSKADLFLESVNDD